MNCDTGSEYTWHMKSVFTLQRSASCSPNPLGNHQSVVHLDLRREAAQEALLVFVGELFERLVFRFRQKQRRKDARQHEERENLQTARKY